MGTFVQSLSVENEIILSPQNVQWFGLLVFCFACKVRLLFVLQSYYDSLKNYTMYRPHINIILHQYKHVNKTHNFETTR